MTETIKSNGNTTITLGVRVGVLCIIAMEYTIAASTPALGAMAAAMPNVNPDLIKQVQTLPALTMILVSLLVPAFEKIAKKKTLLMISAIVLFIGAIGPAFGGGIYYILACRAIFGGARGILFPYAMSFIVDLFDGKDRDRMMGYRDTVGNVVSIVFLQLGGFLATIHWRYAFWAVVLMLPFLVIVWIKVPNPEVKDAPVKEGEKQQKGFPAKTWFMLVCSWIAMVFIYTFIPDIAIFVELNGIGSPSLAATFLTTFAITSSVIGLIFGSVVRPLFKRITVAVGLLFGGCCYLVLNAMPTMAGCFIGGVLFGLGFCIYNISMFLDIPASVRPTLASSSLAYFMAFSGVGHFTNPIILGAIKKMLGLDAAAGGFQICGPVLLVLGAVTIIVKAIVRPKKTTEATEKETGVH